MQKRAVPGALKDSSNSMQHGSRAWSKPNAARPTTAPSAAEQAQVPPVLTRFTDAAYWILGALLRPPERRRLQAPIWQFRSVEMAA